MPDSLPFPATGDRFRGIRRVLTRISPQGLGVAALLVLAGLLAVPGNVRADSDKLPLPRFASLQSNEVNMRAGPGESYPKLWLYQRSGMPVEIIEEFDVWRRVRDYQGTVGWVKVGLLSNKRTAVVTETRRTLRTAADADSPAVALLDPGVIGKLLQCNADWCRIEVRGYQGWLKRDELWGVYPDETVKE
jgi:SH3-like domain-containing protein